jgi:hypothetical protein
VEENLSIIILNEIFDVGKTMNHVFPRPIFIPLVISVLLLNWYFIFIAHSLTFLYYVLWLGGFGIFFLKYRKNIVAHLANWNISHPIKFILLGYAAVLTEEFTVALVHSFTEGFSLPGFGQLIFQFWAFNLFAFTGFILGWYFLLKRYRYSATDLFFIVGAWGLFSEHTLTFLRTNTLAAILLILPTMSTYNLIITPAIASISQFGEKEMNPWKKYPYSFLVIFAFSVIPVLILALLRWQFPGAFPPCEYISC